MSGDMMRRKVTQPVRLTLEKEFSGTFLPLRIGNRMVKFLVDTGACWTLMSLELVDTCGLRNAVTVIHEGGLVTIGVLEAEAEAQGGYMLHFVVAIMFRLDTPLLGMNFLLRYGCMLVLDPQLPLMVARPSRRVKLGLLCGVYKRCKLYDHHVTAMLDTGSTHSFISRALVKQFRLRRRLCKPMLVTLFDGSITVMFRKVSNVEIDIDGLRYSTDLIIHPNKNVSLLLGMNILSGSNLCFEEKQITLSTTNSCYVGREQEPKPTSVHFTPPQFSILNNSSSFVSTTATERMHVPRRLKNWFKNLRPKWLGGGQRRAHEVVGGGRNEAGNAVSMEEEGTSEERGESDEEEMTTATEKEEESVSESDEQENGSEK
uniref:Peptidase A2 domain-containing protein n=1 Tax=Scylla olivacea TaxID=85551 RepID=A0A0P4WC51_SCYOL